MLNGTWAAGACGFGVRGVVEGPALGTGSWTTALSCGSGKSQQRGQLKQHLPPVGR
jgi:hypothetical protein